MGRNELLEFLSSHNDLAPWLANYLGTALLRRGKRVQNKKAFPYVHVPDSYGQYGKSTYLVTIIAQMGSKEEKRETAMEIGRRITKAVSEILPQVLGDERGAPQTGSILLHHLLFLIEGLPYFGQTRQDLLVITTGMYENRNYREGRQGRGDIHGQLVLAIASLVDENENLSEWENRLACDLASADYTVAALSVLVGIDASEAIRRHLCNTMEILEAGGFSPSNLIFGLAYRSEKNPRLEEVVISVLRGGNQHDAIEEFCKSKKALEEV